jgi:hypothetical protein
MSKAKRVTTMSGFASVARQLLTQPPSREGNKRGEALAQLEELEQAGLSKEYTFRVIKEVIDDCTDEDKSIKLAGAKLLVQMHGMLTNDERAAVAPIFNLVIQGDNVKVNSMLCPSFTPAGSDAH